ncbi:MAG: AAA family ATPase, partial [Burkholderiales bacterium]
GIIRGRTVRIWPDNDEPGRKFADDWAAILSGLGCPFSVIDVDALGLPEGGDCVDWLAAHPDADSAMIEALPLSTPSPVVAKASEPVYSSGRYVTLTSAADIEPEPIEWLWDGWLAAGKFHLLGGAPGTGKTTLAIAMAATVSSGGRWPDGTTAEAGDVLIWSGEDDPANTLIPRLILSGGNRGRVRFVVGTDGIGGKLPFDPATDMQRLTEAAHKFGNVRLLIVDPIVSAVAGNSHNNAETRRCLQSLVELGTALNCAVLGITHFTKGTGGSDPVERVTGSIAFAALARVVLVAAKKREPEEGEATRMLARAKSNIGEDDGGFSYDLMQGELPKHRDVIASYVVWGDALAGSAREMLATADMGDDDEGGALSEACEFLADYLSNGAAATKDIQAAAKEAGHSWATVKRAKKRLNVTAEKAGMAGGWNWQLTRRCSPNPEDAHTQSMSTFGKSEHLRQPIEVL